MKPPRDAIETTAMTFWFEDGIIFGQSNGTRISRETVSESLTVVSELTGGDVRPYLSDVRQWVGADIDAWAEVARNVMNVFSAYAMLLAPESSPIVRAFPNAIDKLLIPFETFTDEAEAVAFVRGFLPDE